MNGGIAMNGIQSLIAGLTSALRRINITAHNIANGQTDGFQSIDASTGTVSSTAPGAQSQTRLDLPNSSAESHLPSDVDLSTEVTNLIINKNAFEANINALKAQDETLGSILDIVD